jgi:hypothetical protein
MADAYITDKLLEPSETARAQAHAFSLAKCILNECGPRLAASPNARRAAVLLREAMTPWADDTYAHAFTVRPWAFMAWAKIAAFSYGFALVAAWGGHLLGGPALRWVMATACGLIGFCLVAAKVIMYQEVFETFHDEAEGENVIAVLEPAGEARNQILVSGHHDSAPEFSFLSTWPALYPFRVGLAAWLKKLSIPPRAQCWCPIFPPGYYFRPAARRHLSRLCKDLSLSSRRSGP